MKEKTTELSSRQAIAEERMECGHLKAEEVPDKQTPDCDRMRHTLGYSLCPKCIPGYCAACKREQAIADVEQVLLDAYHQTRICSTDAHAVKILLSAIRPYIQAIADQAAADMRERMTEHGAIDEFTSCWCGWTANPDNPNGLNDQWRAHIRALKKHEK